MKIISPFIFLFVLFISESGFSQNLTSSPYSVFGVGEINTKGSGWNNAMGGTGIALKSENSLNSINPASYNSIDSTFFVYEIGVMGKYSEFLSSSKSQNQIVSNFCYLSMGFRARQWWGISVGITPFSSIGYNIATVSIMENDNTVFDDNYIGSGGINQFYMGNSFKINKNLSFGVNLSYLFGSIEETEEISLNRSYGDYTIVNDKNVHGIYMDYGLQYTVPMQKYNWTIGAVWGNKKELNSSNDKTVSDYADELLFSEEDVELRNDYLIPRKFGIGLSISKQDRFTFTMDYLMNEWSDAEFENKNLQTKNSHKFATGLEFSPEGRYSKKTFKKLYYRMGGYYNSSYLLIDNQAINSMALTFGLGIPVKRNLSMVNVAFEIGKNGTLNNRLIQENYYSLNLNFSLQDIWFVKRKYD